jgi:hypothetical protein
MFVKAWFHFKYLKLYKNKFVDHDSLGQIMFHPITVIENIPEIFTIFFIPMFYYRDKGKYCVIVAVCSIVTISSWLFLMVFVNTLE